MELSESERQISEGLREYFRLSASGVWIVTTRFPDGSPGGFTASSVSSVSLYPPVFSFSLQAGSSCWPALKHTGEMIIHALSTDNVALSQQFATGGIDRFAGIPWHEDEASGLPVLEGVNAWMRATVINVTPVGDSRMILAQAQDSEIMGEQPPLVHFQRAYWQATKLSDC